MRDDWVYWPTIRPRLNYQSCEGFSACFNVFESRLITSVYFSTRDLWHSRLSALINNNEDTWHNAKEYFFERPSNFVFFMKDLSKI